MKNQNLYHLCADFVKLKKYFYSDSKFRIAEPEWRWIESCPDQAAFARSSSRNTRRSTLPIGDTGTLSRNSMMRGRL